LIILNIFLVLSLLLFGGISLFNFGWILFFNFCSFFIGMTMGLLSLDSLKLRIKLRTGTESEKAAVKRILPLLDNHHLLLCTLLLYNAAANEALPIFLDAIVPAWAAVIIAVTLVLLCGEIVPTALFTGPNQLQIASRFTSLVYFLQFIFYPVAYPMAKVLDYILGEGEDDDHLNREEISAMMKILQENRQPQLLINPSNNSGPHDHSNNNHNMAASYTSSTSTIGSRLMNFVRGHNHNNHTNTTPINNNNHHIKNPLLSSSYPPTTTTIMRGGGEEEREAAAAAAAAAAEEEEAEEAPLTTNEVNVITGVLALAKKTIRDIYVPLNEVNMVSSEQILDSETISVIERVGNSRLPVFQGNNITHILGFLRVKKLLNISLLLSQQQSHEKPQQNHEQIYQQQQRQQQEDEEEKKQQSTHQQNNNSKNNNNNNNNNQSQNPVKIGSLPLIPPIVVGCHQSLLEVLTIFQTGHSHLALVSEYPELLLSAIQSSYSPSNSHSTESIPKEALPMGIVSIEDILEEMLQTEIYDEEDITRSPADFLSASMSLREMSMRGSVLHPINNSIHNSVSISNNNNNNNNIIRNEYQLSSQQLQEREAQKLLREIALTNNNNNHHHHNKIEESGTNLAPTNNHSGGPKHSSNSNNNNNNNPGSLSSILARTEITPSVTTSSATSSGVSVMVPRMQSYPAFTATNISSVNNNSQYALYTSHNNNNNNRYSSALHEALLPPSDNNNQNHDHLSSPNHSSTNNNINNINNNNNRILSDDLQQQDNELSFRTPSSEGFHLARVFSSEESRRQVKVIIIIIYYMCQSVDLLIK
jgi:CBS domain containing-hemolysin-like protein